LRIADLLPAKERAEALDILCAHMELLATEARTHDVMAALAAARDQFSANEILLCHLVRSAARTRDLAAKCLLSEAQIIRQDIARRHPPIDLELYDTLIAEA
jgi:hypothetical protein